MTNLQNIGDKLNKDIDHNVSKDNFDMDISGYKILEQCGDGGTAKVYLANQVSLDRQVALKVMLSALSVDEEHTDRFLKEGRVIAKLSHTNIVTIYDVGVSGEFHYIAMEYLPWGSLRQRDPKKHELDWVLNVTEQIASALAFAHENGFIHRDIKPENILFRDENSAVLSDFGIAKVFDSRTQITSRGSLGTPRYMSPDQIRSRPIAPSSDVYSLGVVLFEMLTGKPPYNSEDAVAILYSHIHDPIPALPLECRHLQPLINKMLAKNREDRFVNAGEIVEVLAYLKKEGRLPADLSYLNSNTTSLNQPTVLVDQNTIDTIVSPTSSISSQASSNKNSPPPPKIEPSKDNHTIQVTSDELAVAISTQARIANYKNWSGNVAKQFSDSAAKFATSFKNERSKFSKSFTKPKTTTDLIEPETKNTKINSEGAIKILRKPIILGAILCLTLFALFLMFVSTPEPPQQLAEKSITEIATDETPQNSEALVINDSAQIIDESTNSNLTVPVEPQEEQASEKLLADEKSETKSEVIVTDAEKIEAWLSEAESLIDAGQFITPPQQNALAKYQLALSLDPDNVQALTGMQSILDRFANQANLISVEDAAASTATTETENSDTEQAKTIELTEETGVESLNTQQEKQIAESSSVDTSNVDAQNIAAEISNQAAGMEELKIESTDPVAQTVQELRSPEEVEIKEEEPVQVATANENTNETTQTNNVSENMSENNSEPEILATVTQSETEAATNLKNEDRAEDRINELIEVADFNIQKSYLTVPKGDNAFEVYQQIKEIDPKHPSIAEGMHRIAQKYASAAERRFANGEIERATKLVRRGLGVQPNNEWLQQLKEELSYYGN